MMTLNEKMLQVCRLFRIEGDFLGYDTIQMGNVNQTYEVKFRLPDGKKKSFLVQNVNTYVFKNPVQVMENIDKVTEHIRAKLPDQLTLHFHHTADRKTYVEDGSNFWRMTNFIPCVTYNAVADLRIVRNAGEAFGAFQNQLSDFNSDLLYETIPDFHNTKRRYEALLESAQADPVGRAREVKKELDYLLTVRDIACSLTELQERGSLPLRVTHNDTKINNVLFDKRDGRALVVVDLDTVMPGLVGHDFGDAIRFAANYVEEDSPDDQNAGVDMEVFEAFTEGFLKETASTLTPLERDTLPLSAFVLTAELATRFLADYILGDPYFKIKYPQHNLVRARCQIALAKDMLRKMGAMEQAVKRAARVRVSA